MLGEPAISYKIKIKRKLIRKYSTKCRASISQRVVSANRAIHIDSTKSWMNRPHPYCYFQSILRILYFDVDALFIQTSVFIIINIRAASHQLSMIQNCGSSVFLGGTIEAPTVTDGRCYCILHMREVVAPISSSTGSWLIYRARSGSFLMAVTGGYARPTFTLAPPSSRLPPWTTNVAMHFSSVPIERAAISIHGSVDNSYNGSLKDRGATDSITIYSDSS